MDKSKVVEFWDRAARDAGRGRGSQAGMLAPNALLAQYRQTSEEKHFLKIVRLTPEMDVLEVSAGGGRWSFFMADKVRSVVGVDISREMVDLAESERMARRVPSWSTSPSTGNSDKSGMSTCRSSARRRIPSELILNWMSPANSRT